MGGIGGVPDAVDPGRTGLLVDGSSVDDVTDAISSLLGDPERATQMGAEAAKFVADGFTWDQRTRELRRLLSDVVG